MQRKAKLNKIAQQKSGENKDRTLLAFLESETLTVSTGPLPDPDVLKKYNDIENGIADRIVTMAEKEQGNRHTTTSNIIRYEYKEAVLGKVCYTIISVAAIAGGIITVLKQHPLVGVCIAISPLILAVVAFFKAKSNLEKSEHPKEKVNSEVK